MFENVVFRNVLFVVFILEMEELEQGVGKVCLVYKGVVVLEVFQQVFGYQYIYGFVDCVDGYVVCFGKFGFGGDGVVWVLVLLGDLCGQIVV